MSYLPQIVSARHVKGYVIATRFDDGTKKDIDISRCFKGPVFEPLKNLKFFRRFFIEAGTLAWPNGVDIAPEALYAAQDLKTKSSRTSERTRRKRRSL